MPGFKDSKGRDWTIPEFTEGTIRNIRKELGIDLHLVIDGNQQEAQRAFCAEGVSKMLLYLLTPAYKKAGISEDEAAEAMDRRTRADAISALNLAILDFYHGPENAEKMMKVLRPAMEKEIAKKLNELAAS